MTRAPVFHFGGVAIDPIAYASQGNAILGIRDSGKTYTATELAENLFEAGIPFTAFDPIGVWRFLRVPGRGRGYPIVVAGGQDGDLPLTPASAPAIVEASMRAGVSLVLDLFDMNLSKADWRAIVRDSVKALLHGNGPFGLRHVFLEEAAEFIPQKPMDGLVYAEVEKLARMGGNSRLGFTLINQRSQEVAKAVLELCDNVFLHRQRGKNALENLDKWLLAAGEDTRKQIIASMPDLPQGACWAWMGGDDPQPPKLIQVPPKNSLHPDRRQLHGDAKVRPLPPAELADIHRFVSRVKLELGAAEVAEATKAPAARPPAPPFDPQTYVPSPERLLLDDLHARAMQQAEARGYAEGRRLGYALGVNDAKAVLQGLARAADETLASLDRLRLSEAGPLSPPERAPPAPKQTPDAPAPPVREPDAPPDGERRLTPTQLELLKALAWWTAMGHPQVSRKRLAAMAGLKNGSSHLRARLAELTGAGFIKYPVPGDVALTLAGAAAAPAPDLQKTLLGSIRAILTPTQLQLFEVLFGRQEPITRDDLATATGLTPGASHLRARLAELSAHELIEYPQPGSVQLQAWVRKVGRK